MEKLFTCVDACEYLSVSRKTLWDLTYPKGKLIPVRIGRLVRYRLQELEKFAEMNLVKDESSNNNENKE